MSCYTLLREKGFKLTPQRRLIVDIIHDASAHLTADDIISKVQSRMPGVNKSTIYRTLELLEEYGCVYKSELEHQFIFHHAEEGHHHHLVCHHCNKTIPCDESLFQQAEHTLMDKYGFQSNFNHLIINGVCAECRNKIT